MPLDRIAFDSQIMGGRACVRGMRIPVSTVLKMLGGGMTREHIFADYTNLKAEDVNQCLRYAAMQSMIPLKQNGLQHKEC